MQVIPIKYQSQFFSLHNYKTLHLTNLDAIIWQFTKIWVKSSLFPNVC